MHLLLGLAHAAPVVCDPIEAASLVDEARIEERRAPITHPYLVPGLALASSRATPEVRAALVELCAPGGERSLQRLETWEAPGWAAYTVKLTRAQTRGCALFEQSVAVSVAVEPGAAPRYSLRARLPVGQTPIGACSAVPRWREERVLDGEDGPVRLVLAVDHAGAERVHSEIVVRRASAAGWSEQVLAAPAPERLLGGVAGPRWTLAPADGDTWVVRTHDRTADPCTPVPGQAVWRWEDGTWVETEGRAARTALAGAGHWRLMGGDGWLVILAQDPSLESDLLRARRRRMQRRNPEDPLQLWPSAQFPLLNVGYAVVTPGPYATEEEALRARREWGRRPGVYVKQAWEAPDPCVGVEP